MDYEKKYNEALERAKKVHKYSSDLAEIKRMEDIFPELKESEDERTRKEILNVFKQLGKDTTLCGRNYDYAKWIAWLEKQKSVKCNEDGNKIRKRLLTNFSALGKEEWGGLKVRDICAWLEKQGESYTKRDIDDAYLEGMAFAKKELEKQSNKETLCDKCRKEQPSHSCQDITANGRCYIEGMNTSNNVKPKFKVGDILKHNKANIVCKVLSANVGFYSLISILGGDEMELSNVEKNFHLWTIQDAKDGDVLACGDKITDCPFIFHNLTEELNPRSYCGINTLLHFQDNDENGGFWCQSYEVRPATKEQHDLLFAKMKEAGYEWDAEKKKLKLLVTNGGDFFESENCEQKSAWSEEEEVKINRIVAYLENLNVADNDILLKDVDWLKSIKQRIKGE